MIGRALCLAPLLAACNSHPPFPYAAPDAASPDALATTADAAPGAVSLSVTLRGAPASGAAVYFQSADSTLVLAAMTDEHGSASAVLDDGGYVTVIEPDDGTAAIRLVTFSVTRHGDALHLDLLPTGPIDARTFAVTVPTAPGAVAYKIATSCGELQGDTSGAASDQLVGCGEALDMVSLALDPDGVVIGSLYAPAVPVSATPTVLTGMYRALDPTIFAYTGVPATSPGVSTVHTLATARGSLYRVSTSAPAVSGAAGNSIDMPVTSGAIAVTVSEAFPADDDHGEQRVFDWGAPGPSYALDFTTALLPKLETAPMYDVAARRVSWAEGTGSATANVVRARVHVFRDGPPEGKSWSWWLVAPREAASVAFPRFPPGGFDFTPQPGDAVGVEDLLIASVPGGYDSIRAHGFDPVQTYVTGSSGRLVVETLPSPSM